MFEENGENVPKESMKYRDLLKRNNIDIFKVNDVYHIYNEEDKPYMELVNIKIKYEGYLKQQQEDIDKMLKNENVVIPEDFDYKNARGLREEAKEKLAKIRPLNLGQASRISGVSPADISVLSILIKRK